MKLRETGNGIKGVGILSVLLDIITPEKEEPGYEEAKQKLKRLILNEKVEIKNAQTIDDWGRLVADVYYKGRNLADYFPEYKT